MNTDEKILLFVYLQLRQCSLFSHIVILCKHIFNITDKILHVFFKKVYRNLDYGFLEKVYANTMALELRGLGLHVAQQEPINVHYTGKIIGTYVADIVVEDVVLVELKATKENSPAHETQLLNCLHATPFEVGLLLNFGSKSDFRCKSFDNHQKPSFTWQNPPKNQ